jgi:transposase
MAVAYSTELRERVVRAYQAGEGTQEQIAQRFQVSSSFVQRLLRGYRQSRQVTAKRRGSNHQPKIQGEHLDLVKRLVQSKPDAYLSCIQSIVF